MRERERERERERVRGKGGEREERRERQRYRDKGWWWSEDRGVGGAKCTTHLSNELIKSLSLLQKPGD